MRIRTIKPEFWRSDDITALAREDRLLFIGLWSYVDDNGVGVDDFRAIAADLFALEDDQKEIRDFVREGLATLSRALLIDRYEVDGRKYIHICSWKKHQRVDRPNKVRYPGPPEDREPPTSDSKGPSGESREDVASDSRDSPRLEQRNRGITTTAAADADAMFDEWWSLYPRKVKKEDARKAWRAVLRKKVSPDHLIDAIRRHVAMWRNTNQDPTYIPYPATWLRKGSYDDELEQTYLSVVPAPPQPVTFKDYRDQASAVEAARLLGIAYIPAPQPPSDRTPTQQWARDRAVEWIDAHEQEIRAALTERKTG
jgi:hypothetical protein